MRPWLVLDTAPALDGAGRSRCALHDHCLQSDTDRLHELVTWSTASLGALLGSLASERTNPVGLVYAVIGLLIFGITLTFFLTNPYPPTLYFTDRKSESCSNYLHKGPSKAYQPC